MRVNGRRYVPVFIIGLIGLTLGIGILIGTLVSHGVRAAKVAAVAPDAKPLPAPSPVELSNSFAKIAEAIGPAVVNINTESTVRISRRQFRAPEGSPFDDFFDRFFHFGPFDAPGGEFRQQSLGSGVILDKGGYVLTNYHVVMRDGEERPVDRIRVQLHSDDSARGFVAKIIGSDKWTDLAVIKIDAGKTLPPAQLGDSDSMRVGDWVLAVGSPFGLDSTVTAGIVSAKGRDIGGGPESQFKRFIQTDAAINPGNSGGPLVNLMGQVIGINTAIATRHGAYDGVGFAIPSNTVRKVYNSIISTGGVRRGAIGVQFRNENNPVKLRMFGAEHGIVVESVQAGGPAERAGLKMGDVIVAVNGTPIHNGDELVGVVSETEVGKKLKVAFLRDKKLLSSEIEVGDRNKIVGEALGEKEKEGGEESREQAIGILGLSVRNLTRDQARELSDQLHLSGSQGVLVTDVKPGSFAEDIGIWRGDVLLGINRQTVTSVDEFDRLQAQLKSGTDVLLLVARREGHKFTTVFLAGHLP